jgi:hypothetical protein
MKKIVQLIITIVAFIGSTIGIDFLVGAIAQGDAIFLASYGNFPGQSAGATFMDRYIGFMSNDIIGWFSYVLSSSSQSLETLASGVYVNTALTQLTFVNTSGSAVGLIPILIEYHPWSNTPAYFLPTLLATLRLIVPFIIAGIIGGAIAKDKKQAILNTFLAFLVVGIAGVVVTDIHIYFNFMFSVDWKFDALTTLNPAFFTFQMPIEMVVAGISDPLARSLVLAPMMVPFMININIVAMIYALINGLIISIISVLVARKK